jgi:HlyD family secretion protein
MKKLLAIMVVLWAGGAVGYYYWNDSRTNGIRFRTVAVRRGDLMTTINATGTIEPEEVVDVGVQVAGEVVAFGDDARGGGRTISFGSPVEKGTVLARLDDKLFKARVDQMRASLARDEADVQQAQAKLRQAERDMERNRKLQARGPGMLAPQDADNTLAGYESAKAALAVAESVVTLARANLEEAVANLGYTTIRSPVKGVILDRRVNIGQTVVASLNAPSLFLIAKDLSRMEIWASINETDIGSIHPGQPVRFSVGPFPDDTFRGVVAQTRLNASMVQNVVTYTVVVSIDNTSGRLLPYLTARLEFELEGRRGVLLVPKAALRWQPKPPNVVEELRESYARSLDTRGRVHDLPGAAAGREATLWVPQGEFVRPLKVRVGLNDGMLAEVSGEGITDGTQVVVGVERREEADDAAFLPHTQKPAAKDDAAKKDNSRR